jgi:hypothetical protein
MPTTIRTLAQNFLSCDRDQPTLLPPDLRDWLDEGHLAWFVIEAIDELDLEPFYAVYRSDGHGAAAHEPKMMVGLLAYSYAVGERSSRGIECRCREDVAPDGCVPPARREPGKSDEIDDLAVARAVVRDGLESPPLAWRRRAYRPQLRSGRAARARIPRPSTTACPDVSGRLGRHRCNAREPRLEPHTVAPTLMPPPRDRPWQRRRVPRLGRKPDLLPKSKSIVRNRPGFAAVIDGPQLPGPSQIRQLCRDD